MMTTLAKLVPHGVLIAALLGGSLPASASTSTGRPAVCTVQSAAAAIREMDPVTLPPLAAMQDLTGTAIVRVDLDAAGTPSHPTVVQSSGSAVLDDAARAAVLHQTYAPETRDCAGVAGTYEVAVEFAK